MLPPGPGYAFLYSGGKFTTIAVSDSVNTLAVGINNSGNFDFGADASSGLGLTRYNVGAAHFALLCQMPIGRQSKGKKRVSLGM